MKTILVTAETEERAASLSASLSTSPAIILCDDLPGSEFQSVPVSSEDTAVILYTSGTTGTPKGSKIPHRSLENFSEWT